MDQPPPPGSATYLHIATETDAHLADALGYHVVSAGAGRCVLSWTPRPPWVNRVGQVFGGVVPAVVDVAVGLAVISACDESVAHVPTVSMTVDFLRPLHLGETYSCHGEALRVGGRLAVADAHIRDGDGTLLVRATGTVAIRRKD